MKQSSWFCLFFVIYTNQNGWNIVPIWTATKVFKIRPCDISKWSSTDIHFGLCWDAISDRSKQDTKRTITKFVRMSTWLSCVSCDVMSTVCATDGSWRRKGLGGRQIYICFVAIAHNLFNNIKVICLWVLHSEMKGWVSNCIPTKDINKAKINKK